MYTDGYLVIGIIHTWPKYQKVDVRNIYEPVDSNIFYFPHRSLQYLGGSRFALFAFSKAFHSGFQFRAEVPDETLNGPSSTVSQSTNCMAFNLLAQLP